MWIHTTVRNLHFLSKNSTLISRENCRYFFGWKTREDVVVLDFLAVDNFDFPRKIVKKFGEKLVKMLGFCQNWIFGQKFDFSNSVVDWVFMPKRWFCLQFTFWYFITNKITFLNVSIFRPILTASTIVMLRKGNKSI